jgi:hypothetical protein
MQFVIESSSNLSAWTPIGALTVTNMNGIASITDTNPPASGARFYRAVSH